ncbi:MAG: Flp pilus assembly complex ATPase component TadA [Phycisphaeraceae bacterium]|nr:Flp pilus assembly complex ATPase component TadA [Phycisphaeraceae bacterium]
MTQRPYLSVKTPNGYRQIGLTDDPFTIGRGSSNGLVIDDPLASRFHCVVERTDSGYAVRDLQSRNGTKLNGEYISSAELKPGDAIQVGSLVLRYLLDLRDAPVNPRPAAADGGEAEPEVIVPRLSRKAAAKMAAKVAASVGEDVRAAHADETLVGGPAAGIKGVIKMPEGPREGENPSRQEGSIIQVAAEDEKTLRLLAQSLPNQQFPEIGISMINARGQVVHAGEAHAGRALGDDDVADTVRLMRLLLLVCFRSRATDLHVEPKEERFELRIRVDGMMVKVMNLHKDSGVKLLSLVKILGDIDIAQKAIVQEGHFSSQVPGRRVDYRVSFTPAMNGQKLVVRILDLANAPSRLAELQLPGWMFEETRRVIHQDNGMVLMCGPTGSGKTTTLYSMIREIDVQQRNVITIEDPVEYRIEGVTQIPVNEGKGNTFSSMLRSVLRQDPDVILVGEIRDAETARIAMQAAMTGHLVFSTVHAQNAIGTIFRLLDLGTDPYLVASSLNLVVAQRLVRLLCPHCKLPRKTTPAEQMRMQKAVPDVTKVYQAVGCGRCLETGFHGRRAIYELLTANSEMRDVILSTRSIQGIRKAMNNSLFTSLLENGYKLVAEGMTTIEEIERVASME